MPERKPVMNNEQISPVTECPVIPLAGKIAYPDMTINLLLSRKSDIRAFEEVYKNSGKILLVPQKDPTEENPDNTGFYKVGTVCKINQFARKSENRILPKKTGLLQYKASCRFLQAWIAVGILERLTSTANIK